MKVTIKCAPSYAMGYCHLDDGESVYAESGAMVAMSPGVVVSAGAGGSITRGLLRKALGGESFLLGKYTATQYGAWVAFAPPLPGDMIAVDLAVTGQLYSQTGSMLAYDENVSVSVTKGTVATAVMAEGVTLLAAEGSGQVLLCSYGGIQRFDLDANQSVIIDTGHLVAYTRSCSTEAGMVGSAAASAASGEGLAMRVRGPGIVWIQTRAEQALTSWLLPKRGQNRR